MIINLLKRKKHQLSLLQTKKKRYKRIEINLALLLTIFLIYLQAIDFIFTRTGLRVYGIEAEGNPIVKEVIKYLGIDLGLGSVKLLAIFILFLVTKYINIIYNRRLLSFLIFLNLLYLFAAYTWSVLLF